MTMRIPPNARTEPGEIPDVRLVRALYSPTFLDVPPVSAICEVVRSAGTDYVWIDALDPDGPILVPLSASPGIEELGMARSYFHEHAEQVQQILVVSDRLGLSLSTALVVRCAEVMLEENLSAARALEVSMQWARTLLDLDDLEREAFNAVFAEAAGELRAAEESALAAAEASAKDWAGAYERPA